MSPTSQRAVKVCYEGAIRTRLKLQMKQNFLSFISYVKLHMDNLLLMVTHSYTGLLWFYRGNLSRRHKKHGPHAKDSVVY